MERLIIRFEVLCKAMKTLKDTIDVIYDNQDIKIHSMIRDSQIQRFEYCYESIWLFLKDYIELEYRIKADKPRIVFQEAYRISIINNLELVILLEMIRDRNQTSHIYLESIAKRIAKQIPKYYELINSIINRLENDVNRYKKN